MASYIVLCMGSNQDGALHLQQAHSLLLEAGLRLQWANSQVTQPIDCPCPNNFVNQVGVGYTHYDYPRLKQKLKEIESQCGRRPEDKQAGIVKLDIDLLRFGDQYYKPYEWDRAYIKEGLKEIQASETDDKI